MLRTVKQLRDALADLPDDMHLETPLTVCEGRSGPFSIVADPYYVADARNPRIGWLRTCAVREADETEQPNLGWRMPSAPGHHPVAQSYGEGWDLWLSPDDADQDDFPGAGEIEWPFKSDYDASDEDMRALGFEVI